MEVLTSHHIILYVINTSPHLTPRKVSGPLSILVGNIVISKLTWNVLFPSIPGVARRLVFEEIHESCQEVYLRQLEQRVENMNSALIGRLGKEGGREGGREGGINTILLYI